jgi:hypothetical protein
MARLLAFIARGPDEEMDGWMDGWMDEWMNELNE